MGGRRIVPGTAVASVIGAGVLEVGMVMVSDVKVQVEETGTHLAVVMPVVRGVQAEAHHAHGARERQAGARRPQQTVHGSAESSHVVAPR
jgi:hypothetical protein